MLLCFFGCNLAVAHDDDLVADADTAGRSAVETDHAGAALSRDHIGREAVSVIDVDDFHLFVLQDAGTVHQVLIDRDGADIVQGRLDNGRTVDFAFKPI